MQKQHIGIALFAILSLSAPAQDMSDNFYRAIRNDKLSEVRDLIKSAGLTVKDKRGTTPLMMAAAYGSLDSMKLLIDAGADVNAKNDFDATALMWCSNDAAKVRLLLSKGANVNAKSKQSRTPLLLAAAHDGASETVKLLLDRGADPKARTNTQAGALLMAAEANDTASAKLLLQKGLDVNDKDKYGNTPLMSAAAHGNLELVKLFLAKGADVNAVSSESSGDGVKNGPIALGSFTPLILAAAYGGGDVVKVLLDAGAKVDARDVRGMTPLMLAVATDRPDLRVIRMLADKADKSIRSKAGETALDWARKFNSQPVLAVFGEKAQAVRATALTPVADRKPAELRPAVEKSIGLLQSVSDKFFSTGGCASCHAQNLTGLALSAARAQGVAINEASEAGGLQGAKGFWASFEQPLLQRMDPPGACDTLMYALLHFSAGKIEPGPVTDAMVHNLAGEQRANGAWHFGGVARAPMEDGDFSRTAFSVRALRLYGMPGRKADLDQRIGRAADWLREAVPQNMEDQNMQLLGLKWAGADARTLDRAAKKIAAMQRGDGGWAQTGNLPSDAYATGQALYAMQEAGTAAGNPVYQRGVEYLLRTQLADGSWHVKSRAPKFQPYFQSGFPHDHDQWISMSATAWAATALANALPAARRTVAAVQ